MATLCIPDLHEPFVHPKALLFAKDMRKKYDCKDVVFLGDIADQHAISFHDHDPSGWGAGNELKMAQKGIDKWHKEFPNSTVCIGNHDERFHRRALRFGLPSEVIRSLREIYNTESWSYQLRVKANGVLYTHGTGMSGKTAHIRLAEAEQTSAVMGHVHAFAGIDFRACHNNLVFGMNAGCLLDIGAYAMEYSRDFRNRPVLGVGIVFDQYSAIFEPMPLERKRYKK